MIRAAGAVERFRVPILHALYDLSDERSANQLCELGGHYAESGDETFRVRLYEIVEMKPFADNLWLGEEEILRLDGENAFLFAARVRGESLSGRGWEWDDGGLIDHATERFGHVRVNALLENTQDRAIRTYRERWREENRTKAGRAGCLPHRERMRSLTVGEILAEAESQKARFGLLRGWGMYADEADLAIILEHIWDAARPIVIANLLQVFSNRAAAEFDARLIEMCQYGYVSVRRKAIRALENVEHPSIRDFALAELEGGLRGESVVGLFTRNYLPGDEQRIVGGLRLPDDDFELHGLLMDVIKVLEANPDADCTQLGVIAYASTPCENCRADAARLLYRQHVAPRWLSLECPFDSSEECRELATLATGPAQDQTELR